MKKWIDEGIGRGVGKGRGYVRFSTARKTGFRTISLGWTRLATKSMAARRLFGLVFGLLLSGFLPRLPMPLKRFKRGLDCVKMGWFIRG